MLWVVARFGLSGQAHPGVSRQAMSLELALRRLVDDMASHVGEGGSDDDREAAVRQVEQVRAAVADLPGWQPEREEVPAEALADLGRTNAVLRRYAAMHGYNFPSA